MVENPDALIFKEAALDELACSLGAAVIDNVDLGYLIADSLENPPDTISYLIAGYDYGDRGDMGFFVHQLTRRHRSL